MKAKKIVRIELKSPALRRIRKNFRDVIKLAVDQESSRLYYRLCQYRKQIRESTNPAKKERFSRQTSEFGREGCHLMGRLSKSIIQCGSGGLCSSLEEAIKHGFDPKDRPTDLDMVWLPVYEGWFCTPCSERLIEESKILREERHPDHMRHLWEMGLLGKEEKKEFEDDLDNEIF